MSCLSYELGPCLSLSASVPSCICKDIQWGRNTWWYYTPPYYKAVKQVQLCAILSNTFIFFSFYMFRLITLVLETSNCAH